MTTSKPLFEATTCTRCSGSGRYSWCQAYGDVCFKCAGRGWVLTKRGAAAARFFRELLSKPVEQLQPGDLIRIDGFTAGSFSQPTRWFKVLSVETGRPSSGGSRVDGVWTPSRYDAVRVECEGFSGEYFPGQLLRVSHDADQKQAKLAQARAYEASLTKTGKPRKAGLKAA